MCRIIADIGVLRIACARYSLEGVLESAVLGNVLPDGWLV